MHRAPPQLTAAGLVALGELGNQPAGASCTDPTISSSLGNVANQSGAYTPTLTHDGASVATTAVDTTTGLPVVVTGSTTTTPSVPEPTAGHTLLVTHTTTASDGLTTSIAFAVSKAAAAGASWTEEVATDYTSDITDLTLTLGAGDTTLYENDGTTPKATVGAVQRLGSGGIARITAADGGGYIEEAGTTQATTLYQRVDLSALSIDPEDTTTVLLVHAVVTGQSLSNNNDGIAVRLGNGPDSSDASFYGWGMQQRRNSGTAYIRRGIQNIAGSGSVGADQDSQTSIRAATVTTFVVSGGRIADVFSTPGTTVPTGVPTVSSTVLKSDQNSYSAIESGASITDVTDLYVHCEAFSGGAGTASCVLERVEVHTLTLP